MALRVEPVTPDRWTDLERLFGRSGAYSGCWCTWWRCSAAEWDAGARDGAAGNRALLHRLTADGAVPGLLGYDGGLPVGWVSVAPRPQFGRLLRSRTVRPDPADPVAGDPADPSVWSVVCFWLPRAHRGRGVGTALLAGAVAHADSAGARLVEGYPVDPAGERRPAAEVYTGTLAMFGRAGFVETARRGRRCLVRRVLGPQRSVSAPSRSV